MATKKEIKDIISNTAQLLEKYFSKGAKRRFLKEANKQMKEGKFDGQE